MKCDKRKYPEQVFAERAISKAWRGKATWRGKQLPTRCYKCKHCGFWHLTSKPLMTPAELAEIARSRYQHTA